MWSMSAWWRPGCRMAEPQRVGVHDEDMAAELRSGWKSRSHRRLKSCASLGADIGADWCRHVGKPPEGVQERVQESSATAAVEGGLHPR